MAKYGGRFSDRFYEDKKTDETNLALMTPEERQKAIRRRMNPTFIDAAARMERESGGRINRDAALKKADQAFTGLAGQVNAAITTSGAPITGGYGAAPATFAQRVMNGGGAARRAPGGAAVAEADTEAYTEADRQAANDESFYGRLTSKYGPQTKTDLYMVPREDYPMNTGQMPLDRTLPESARKVGGQDLSQVDTSKVVFTNRPGETTPGQEMTPERLADDIAAGQAAGADTRPLERALLAEEKRLQAEESQAAKSELADEKAARAADAFAFKQERVAATDRAARVKEYNQARNKFIEDYMYQDPNDVDRRRPYHSFTQAELNAMTPEEKAKFKALADPYRQELDRLYSDYADLWPSDKGKEAAGEAGEATAISETGLTPIGKSPDGRIVYRGQDGKRYVM